MFRLLTLVVAIGASVYRALYGSPQKSSFVQTTCQPLCERAKTPPCRTQAKPEVLFGDPLTDEEWELFQRSEAMCWN